MSWVDTSSISSSSPASIGPDRDGRPTPRAAVAAIRRRTDELDGRVEGEQSYRAADRVPAAEHDQPARSSTCGRRRGPQVRLPVDPRARIPVCCIRASPREAWPVRRRRTGQRCRRASGVRCDHTVLLRRGCPQTLYVANIWTASSGRSGSGRSRPFVRNGSAGRRGREGCEPAQQALPVGRGQHGQHGGDLLAPAVLELGQQVPARAAQ